MVVEFGDEGLGAPGRKFAAGTADAQRGYPATGSSSGVHGVVQQRRRGADITDAQACDRESAPMMPRCT